MRLLRFSPALLVLILVSALPSTAQTVLFDGLVQEDRQAAALLVPAVVTGDDYSLFGRLEYGVADRANLFAQLGGRFNGDSTLVPGVGWAATIYRQADPLPINIGFFNSFLFPIDGGPDALITVAPVLSHSWSRDNGGRITPYVGATTTFKINNPGRGRTDVNGLLGVKVTEIAPRWDFAAEIQPGEETQFALGFTYRF